MALGNTLTTVADTTITITEDTTLTPINAMRKNLCIIVSNGATLTCAQAMTFSNGVDIDIQNGKLLISANVTFKSDSQIEVSKGSIEINADTTLTIGRYSTVSLHRKAKITGSGTLKGEQGSIEAPVRQIFGSDLTVAGNWINLRVYPQWFGAVGYATANETDTAKNKSTIDSAPAINKAIQMKGIGEVFIPRGFYRISSVINMKMGIVLSGETGFERQNDATGTGYDYGTVLATYFDMDDFEDNLLNPKNLNNFVLRINANDTEETSTWQLQYPQLGTTVRNMRFVNYTPPTGEKFLNCVIAFDSVTFDTVTFVDFCQAVKYSPDLYIDTKVIKNCTYYCDDKYKNTQEVQPYQEEGGEIETKDDNGNSIKKYERVLASFDMGFLGDGVLFEHNAVHSDNGAVGLHFTNCGSGSINANILNTNIVINSSKGIDFSANHIEGNHKIKVVCSEISIRNNYIWIHNAPSVIVLDSEYLDKSVVSLDGNVFRYYDTEFYDKPINPDDEKDKNRVITDTGTDKYIIPYEVAISNESIVTINNCFRYWGDSDFGKMYTSGIYLTKFTENQYFPLDEFNQLSYALSQSSAIGPGYKITANFSINGIKDLQLNPVCMKNNGVRWIGENGDYTYKIQILFDASRGIGSDVVDATIESVVLKLEKDYSGVLINTNNPGGCYIVRLYRSGETDNGEINEYVDVPMCGTCYLYDNGISVNGFEWKDATSDIEVGISPTIYKFDYHNGNIVVFLNASTVLADDLKPGDVAYLDITNTFQIIK